MIIFLALRNLAGYRKNTIVIVSLITVIISVFFIGNTLLSESDKGLHRTYVENYTGEIVIKAKSDVPFGIFGADTPAVGDYFSIPVLKNLNQIEDLLRESSFISNYLFQVSGAAVMDIGGRRYKVPVFGVDGDDYFAFFRDIDILKGRTLQTGKQGLMLSAARAERIERETGKEVNIGDMVLLSMYGNNGFKIREVPVTGIFSYRSAGMIMDEIVIADSQTLRALNSMTLASTTEETAAVDDQHG